MTIDDLINESKTILGSELKSVVLYGSAARGDQTKHFSDLNVLYVVETLNLKVLRGISPLITKWTKAGNRAPVLFTSEQIRESRDVFPVEFLDIQASHRVLFGENPFQNLHVETANLRHQLEYELRGKVIKFRQAFVEAGGKPDQVREILAKIISPLSVLFLGVLRLMGRESGGSKKELWAALAAFTPIDTGVLDEILVMRDTKTKLDADTSDRLAERLLHTMESVIGFVNKQGK